MFFEKSLLVQSASMWKAFKGPHLQAESPEKNLNDALLMSVIYQSHKNPEKSSSPELSMREFGTRKVHLSINH